jgi:oxygen-independent coproporphyrinogen-3 oxidase
MLKPTVEHLYLHIPFCAKICPYCSFYVHGGAVSKQEGFVDALVSEIRQANVEWNLKTIFIGGGTPSMISPLLFEKILKSLPPLESTGEFTLEVNPATVTEKKMEVWKKGGVNRISLGVQSFREEELKILGRQHSPEEAAETFKSVVRYGFCNVSMDLIFGLPGQTGDHWRENLKCATSLASNHLSAYQLTYEEDTPFFEKMSRGLIVPDEEARGEMFQMTEVLLGEVGLSRYEISNYSKAGFESRHNQAYWDGKNYLGLGPSAVSTVQMRRWTNVPDTDRYISDIKNGRDPHRTIEELTPDILWKERVMLGLRTRQGLPQSHFELRVGSLSILQKMRENGLMQNEGGQWTLTSTGRLVSDSVAESFF